MVPARRLQVLTNGEKIHLGGAQIVHQLQHLFALFAEADHDAGFGEDGRIDFLDPLQ